MGKGYSLRSAIRRVMKARRWTQVALAEADGVRYSAVQRMCSAEGNPTIDTLTRRLEIMGYGVALVPDDAELPDGCLRLSPRAGAGTVPDTIDMPNPRTQGQGSCPKD